MTNLPLNEQLCYNMLFYIYYLSQVIHIAVSLEPYLSTW